jgi:hypothetical protein
MEDVYKGEINSNTDVMYCTVAAKKIARVEKNARLFSGILSNDPKLFIFFS